MVERRRNFVHNIPAAKALRRPQTRTEDILWQVLRDRQLCGWKFRRQHAIGKYVVDFYCHELRLVLEVDGGVHHAPERAVADRLRQADLEETGLRFLRIPTSRVEGDLQSVVREVEEVLSKFRRSANKEF